MYVLTCLRKAVAVSGMVVSTFVARPSVAQNPAVETLPAGTWTVVSRSGGRALLAARPQRQRGARAAPGVVDTTVVGARYGRTVVFAEGGVAKEVRGARQIFSLPDAVLGQAPSIRARSVTFGSRAVLYGVVGEGPQFRESPTRSGELLFEYAGNTYRVNTLGRVSSLVADTARGFDRAALLAKAETLAPDGESTALLWATTPQWSPDGRLVAFATNREALDASRSGQSLWVANARGGGERPLLVSENDAEVFAPLGWLGREILYGQRSGGLWAIDPSSGQRRQVSTGKFLAADSRGASLALATATDAGVTVSVLQRGSVTNVPAPPSGYRYEYFAAFSPNGTRLALVARTREGAQRIAIYTLATQQLDVQEVPGTAARAPFTDPPAWLTEARLLVNAVDAVTATEHAYVIRAR